MQPVWRQVDSLLSDTWVRFGPGRGEGGHSRVHHQPQNLCTALWKCAGGCSSASSGAAFSIACQRRTPALHGTWRSKAPFVQSLFPLEEQTAPHPRSSVVLPSACLPPAL